MGPIVFLQLTEFNVKKHLKLKRFLSLRIWYQRTNLDIGGGVSR